MKLNANQEVIASVAAYSLCSGTLVLLNKLTLHQMPYPSIVVCFQLASTIAFIYTAKTFFNLPVDELQWKFIVPYLYYIVAFALGVYCNMRSLNTSNVETIIVFRALSPCLVAFLDGIFLGREFPSVRSWIALLTIVAGAFGYANFDNKFQSQGYSAYFWPTCYLLIISFEMCYGVSPCLFCLLTSLQKKIIKSVDLKTKSGPVLYTNLLGIWPMLMFAGMGNEFSKFDSATVTPVALFFLLLGCVAGTGIGYSSWWCRDKVSATFFTLIGVMNKCLTILLNFVIWENHANIYGIICLSLCLIGGSMYRQAPMRKSTVELSKAVTQANEDVWEDDATDRNHDEEALLKRTPRQQA